MANWLESKSFHFWPSTYELACEITREGKDWRAPRYIHQSGSDRQDSGHPYPVVPQVCLLLKYAPQTGRDHDNHVATLLFVELNNSMRPFRVLLLRWPAIFIALP